MAWFELKAIQDFNYAIKLNPKHAKAFYNRGLSYRQLKKEETAIADFKKAESIDPTIIAQEQTKKAEENFEKGFKKIQESNKKVRKLQEILEGLEGGHQEEDNWFKRSKWAVIITILMFILFGFSFFQSSNTAADNRLENANIPVPDTGDSSVPGGFYDREGANND